MNVKSGAFVKQLLDVLRPGADVQDGVNGAPADSGKAAMIAVESWAVPEAAVNCVPPNVLCLPGHTPVYVAKHVLNDFLYI